MGDQATMMKFIEKIPVSLELGKELYKYLFANAPQVKKWFAGAENFSPDDVMSKDRFDKQGIKTLLAVHVLAHVWHDQNTFKHQVTQLVRFHDRFPSFNDTIDWYKAFFPLALAFIKSKTSLSADEEKAVTALGDAFLKQAAEAIKQK
jgi:hypothetical protein